ncbi:MULTISPECIES: hypothetical protein [Paenibacillus]|uniref:hypothetical protein n=1 Tax=Paenibacillus TaxID=44249 RepID=UPI000FE183EF|nr:hypothetical protein [Paenibacillus sp. DCT19]
MKKKLKLFSLLVLTSVLLLSACSSSENSSINQGESNNEEVTELKVAFPIFGALPKDMPLIEGAVNALAQRKST